MVVQNYVRNKRWDGLPQEPAEQLQFSLGILRRHLVILQLTGKQILGLYNSVWIYLV